MTANGRVKLAIPPGHVDAFCAVEKRDVVIPEGTLGCPNGDHDVEVTSLPRMPEPDLPRPVPVAALSGERAAAVDPVALPSIREATSFGRAASDLVAALEREERQALADFEAARERVLAARRSLKVLRAALGLVRLPERSALSKKTTAPAPTEGSRAWSKHHPACINCGTTSRKHAVQGRCTACHAYWRDKGGERPASLDSKEQPS
jgi:hypothetical protein